MLIYIVSVYLFIAVFLTFLIAAYAFSRNHWLYLRFFSVFVLCISIYLLGYLLEINSATIEQMLFWNQIQYFVLPFIPAIWLILVLLYTKGAQVLRWARFLLLLPVVTFLVRISNNIHLLFYRDWVINTTESLSILHLKKGPWYFVNSTYILLTLGAATIILFLKYRGSMNKERSRLLLLIQASWIPYIGLLLIIYDYRAIGLDYAALLMPVAVLIIFIAIVRYDFLEIKALARETAFEYSSDGMILLDNNLTIIDHNQTVTELLSLLPMKSKDLTQTLEKQPELMATLQNTVTSVVRLWHGQEERFIEIRTDLMHNFHGQVIGSLKTLRDVTENNQLQKRMEYLATTDELSGLNNRRELMKLAQLEFNRASRYNHDFSLLMIDIDHFKKVNDSQGHGAGDAVIAQLGKLLKNSMRSSDIVGRFGGEEFVLILPNTDLLRAKNVAENLRKTIKKKKFFYNNITINITISIGVSAFFQGAKNIDQLFEKADTALYKSKSRGRNCTTLSSQRLPLSNP